MFLSFEIHKPSKPLKTTAGKLLVNDQQPMDLPQSHHYGNMPSLFLGTNMGTNYCCFLPKYTYYCY